MAWSATFSIEGGRIRGIMECAAEFAVLLLVGVGGNWEEAQLRAPVAWVLAYR
jgi:hypothetical protein